MPESKPKEPFNWIYLIGTLLAILGLSPALVYLVHFSSGNLTDDNLSWSQFGTYLSGTLSPVIALTAAMLTFAVGLLTNTHNKNLLEKQQAEKRPLLNVGYVDMEDKIAVMLHNKGLGPLTITKYEIAEKGGIIHTNFFDCLEGFSCSFDNYTSDLTGLALSANQSINLIRLEKVDGDAEYEKNRDQLRQVLGKLEVKVEYKDVYDNPMTPYARSLVWFARHAANPKKKWPAKKGTGIVEEEEEED